QEGRAMGHDPVTQCPGSLFCGRGTRFHAWPSNCESTELPITVFARAMTYVNITTRFVDCVRKSVGDCSAPAAKKSGPGHVERRAPARSFAAGALDSTPGRRIVSRLKSRSQYLRA